MNPSVVSLTRTAVVFALACPLACAADLIRLHQAVEAAVARADRDTSGESAAKAQLNLLRSLDRTKVELRPQIGIFSFSQPSLVATSAGAGVVVSRRTAPGQPALQGAELDVIAAEIAHKRERLRVEIDTAREFFELVARQEHADRTCGNLQEAKRRQVEMVKLVKNAKLTAIDLTRFDEQVLERQLDCVDAETQRKLAAIQLATLMGSADRSGDMRVDDVDLPVAGPDRPLPPPDKLFELAMSYRTEPAMLRDQITAIAPKSEATSRLRPDVISAGFYRVQESSKFTSASTPNYLLGGNTVRAEATWAVPLRNTGEQPAAKSVLEARVHALEAQLEALRDEIRNQLAAVHVLASASLEKLPVARRKMELANKSRVLLTTRFQTGLSTSTAVFDAEQQTVQAENGFTQATCDLKASTFLMLALAGIEDKPAAEQQRLLGYSLPPSYSSGQATPVAVSR